MESPFLSDPNTVPRAIAWPVPLNSCFPPRPLFAPRSQVLIFSCFSAPSSASPRLRGELAALPTPQSHEIHGASRNCMARAAQLLLSSATSARSALSGFDLLLLLCAFLRVSASPRQESAPPGPNPQSHEIHFSFPPLFNHFRTFTPETTFPPCYTQIGDFFPYALSPRTSQV